MVQSCLAPTNNLVIPCPSKTLFFALSHYTNLPFPLPTPDPGPSTAIDLKQPESLELLTVTMDAWLRRLVVYVCDCRSVLVVQTP